MSLPDYEIHLNRNRVDSLWGSREDDAEQFPFGEDMDLIDKMIEEEIGTPRRKRKRKLPRR